MPEIEEIKQKVSPILLESGVTEAYLFGSTARGDNQSNSDIDLMIDKLNQPVTFFTIGKLVEQLEGVLHKKVDLVFDKSIKALIRPHIIKNRIKLI